MKLCCIFNYAPAYRESIYLKIDQLFDVQFCFAREVHKGQKSGIKQLDWHIFNTPPIEIENKVLFKRFQWRTGIQKLPFRAYDKFLISGDLPLSYFPFLVVCRIMRKPVYAWGHGAKTFRGGTGFLQRIFYRLVTGYFTYGDYGRLRLEELGVNKEKVWTIYNSLNEGVDERLNDRLKSDIIIRHFKNHFPTIVFVGRLTEVKKIDWLIKAKLKHNDCGVFYNLLIIGDGPTFDKLKAICESSGIINEVWFFGECYEESKIDTLLYNSDLCVSPGNVGLSALHSMTYGTPVISHNDFNNQMPEYETIVDGVTGYRYKYNDFEDLCLSIQKWLNLKIPRDQIRNNCYAMINKKWNSNYQIKLLERLLS